jgi:hypothetical protein
MEKTVEFLVKNPKSFISYLKRFILINDSLLLEMDLKNKHFIAKTSNEMKSVVKKSSIDFNTCEFETSSKLSICINIGIHSISKLIKIIDQFKNEFFFVVKFDEILLENEKTENLTISILLKDNCLKFNYKCVSLNYFKFIISEDKWKNTINKFDKLASFEFTKDNIERIKSLCELDKDYEYVELLNKTNKIFIRGRSFEFSIDSKTSASDPDTDVTLSFYKEQLNKIDNEDYFLTLGFDRLLFTSKVSDTFTIISKTEGDPNPNFPHEEESAF